MELALFIAIVGIGFASVINVMSGISDHSGDILIRDAMTNAMQQKLDEIRSDGYYSALAKDGESLILQTGSFDIQCSTSVVFLTEDLSDTSFTDLRIINVTVETEHPDYGVLRMTSIMTPLDNVSAL